MQLEEVKLLKDFVYGLDSRAKDVHTHKYMSKYVKKAGQPIGGDDAVSVRSHGASPSKGLIQSQRQALASDEVKQLAHPQSSQEVS